MKVAQECDKHIVAYGEQHTLKTLTTTSLAMRSKKIQSNEKYKQLHVETKENSHNESNSRMPASTLLAMASSSHSVPLNRNNKENQSNSNAAIT